MTIPAHLIEQVEHLFDDLSESPETRGGGAASDDDETPATYGRPPEGEAVVDTTQPIPGGGPLLEDPDARRLFRTIDNTVRRQDRLARNRDEEGTHWERVRDGIPFTRLHKSEDRSVIRALIPPGVLEQASPVPNKVLDVSKRIIAQVVVDPPLPNPRGEGETDRTRGACDLARKYLRADGGPMGTDDTALWKEVLAVNMVRKSAFVRVWVDPHGGGWRPKQIMAHPQAVDPAQPFVNPSDGSYSTQHAVLRYVGETEDAPDPFTGESVTREVFVTSPAEAARQWMPKHRRKLLHPNQVRTIPATADVKDADQIIVVEWEPLCEARKRFPILNELSDEKINLLCQWRPPHWQRIVPSAMRKAHESQTLHAPHDDTLLFWYHVECPIKPDYPDGAVLDITGGGPARNGDAGSGFVLHRDTLREDVTLDDGTVVPVLMDPSIIQFKALPDVTDGDPQGHAMIADWAGSKELLDVLYSAIVDITERGLNPNVYIPATSPVTREEFNRRDGTPLEVLTKDDLPFYEPQPEAPVFADRVLEKVERDLDSAAGMSETSKGLDSRYAISGEAKKVSISQAKVALSQYWQGFISGVLHYWTVKIQQAQAKLTVPQLVKLAGENSSHKQRWFVGHDLVGVTDILLAPGSGTMMTAAEKAQWLGYLQQNQWLVPEQAGELARSSMSDDLGLPPSPHEDRIDRAIAEWADGPPPGWMEAYQAYILWQQQAMQAQQMAQGKAQEIANYGIPPERAMAAANAQFAMPPQPPPFYNPFTPRPNDEEPMVAREHHRKLTRFMATSDYMKWDGPWRQLFDERYAQAAYAAGIVTVRQQHEMQAQQQQAAAQQAAEKDATQGAESERQRQHDASEAERDRQAEAQQAQLSAAQPAAA